MILLYRLTSQLASDRRSLSYTVTTTGAEPATQPSPSRQCRKQTKTSGGPSHAHTKTRAAPNTAKEARTQTEAQKCNTAQTRKGSKRSITTRRPKSSTKHSKGSKNPNGSTKMQHSPNKKRQQKKHHNTKAKEQHKKTQEQRQKQQTKRDEQQDKRQQQAKGNAAQKKKRQNAARTTEENAAEKVTHHKQTSKKAQRRQHEQQPTDKGHHGWEKGGKTRRQLDVDFTTAVSHIWLLSTNSVGVRSLNNLFIAYTSCSYVLVLSTCTSVQQLLILLVFEGSRISMIDSQHGSSY